MEDAKICSRPASQMLAKQSLSASSQRCRSWDCQLNERLESTLFWIILLTW